MSNLSKERKRAEGENVSVPVKCELPRQLCEICGIKEKWVEYITKTTDGCVGLGKKRVFPNFTQPENFAKLLELKIKTKKREVTLCEILHLEYGFANRFEFLKYLKSHLAGTKYFSGSYIFSNREQIKQAIRETEWVYE